MKQKLQLTVFACFLLSMFSMQGQVQYVLDSDGKETDTIIVNGEKLFIEDAVIYLKQEPIDSLLLVMSKLTKPKDTFYIHNQTKYFAKNAMIKYKEDIRVNKDTKEKLLFNDKMLNLLFADKIGTAFGGSSDLSLEEFYASISSKDNEISLGFNYDGRDDKLTRLKNIYSLGLKLKSSDEFATIYDLDNGFAEENIGVTLKFTNIRRGLIDFGSGKQRNKSLGFTEEDKDRESAVNDYRELLEKTYKNKAKKFNEGELKEFIENHIKLSKYKEDPKTVAELIEDKENEWYKEIAEKEIEFLEDYKAYKYLRNQWWAFEAFFPLSEEKKNVTNDVQVDFSKKRIWNFNSSLTYNIVYDYSSSMFNSGWFDGQLLFVKLGAAVKNSNTLLVNNISAKKFQKFSDVAGGYEEVNSKDVFVVTDYEKFMNSNAFVELAYFPFTFDAFTFGISVDVEKNFGTYDKVNWSAGLPFSIKDKEGKPKVNFELLYRKQSTLSSTEELIGISANFLFGKLID